MVPFFVHKPILLMFLNLHAVNGLCPVMQALLEREEKILDTQYSGNNS